MTDKPTTSEMKQMADDVSDNAQDIAENAVGNDDLSTEGRAGSSAEDEAQESQDA